MKINVNRRRRGHYSSYGGGYSGRSVSSGPNPQPGLAQVWLRQARFDLEAVTTDVTCNFEWACFKSFQVGHL